MSGSKPKAKRGNKNAQKIVDVMTVTENAAFPDVLLNAVLADHRLVVCSGCRKESDCGQAFSSNCNLVDEYNCRKCWLKYADEMGAADRKRWCVWACETRRQLMAAAEADEMILRVDDIIKSAPRQREQQGYPGM